MNLIVEHLKNVFYERCRQNEQYSLRAFARSLSVPVSSLSEIMNEKRPLSKKLINELGKKLNMSEGQISGLIQTKNKSPDDYQQIALDSFYIISEWHHYGILQLLKTKDFKNDSSWIAKRLNITSSCAQQAIDRLLRVGILETSEDGKLTDVTYGHTSHLYNNVTNEQLRNFQINALEKAISSLKSVPIEFRDNTSMTFAVSREAIPFAKEEIKKFRRKLTKKLEDFGPADEVYQLAISLSPLTDINGDTNEMD
jgi:predicted transcriptional regulator